MNRGRLQTIDFVALTVLAAGAAGIAFECFRRGATLGTLMLGAMALGLVWRIGQPWRFQTGRGPISTPAMVVSAGSLLVGLATELILPLAVAWTAALWIWLSGRLQQRALPRVSRLLWLALFIFPWLDTDLKSLGWAMRITSAIAAQPVLASFGLDTTREGTMLFVAGQPIEVSEVCDGGQTLHAMLIIGLAAAYLQLGRRTRIWPWFPVLFGLAWLANTLRVILISAAAAEFGEGRVFTWIHDTGGWLVVSLMIGVCLAWFAAWKRIQRILPRQAIPRSFRPWQQLSNWRQTGRMGQLALWGLLVVCVTVGVVWRMVPLADASDRLRHLPTEINGRACTEVPLTESEQQRMGDAKAVKRVYRCGGRDFLITVIDGTANRRAVHDPMYCWTVMSSMSQPLPGGEGSVVTVVDQGIQKEVLYWFSDGTKRHASPARYLLHSSLRRAFLGHWGAEQLLVLLEPLDPSPVNWYRVLDELSWLMQV